MLKKNLKKIVIDLFSKLVRHLDDCKYLYTSEFSNVFRFLTLSSKHHAVSVSKKKERINKSIFRLLNAVQMDA